MSHEINGKPIFSTSEELAFKTCKLAHYFEYGLGYRPAVTNRKLALGISVHLGLEAHYKGESFLKALTDYETERWEEIKAAGNTDSKTREDFVKDSALALAMVRGYIGWIVETGLDDAYETVAVEDHHYVEVPGAPCVLPIKVDLLQRHKQTERLRVVDFKTAASFSSDTTKFQLAEQNGNYQLGIFAVYDERPTEMVYRELRKIVPSARSKPPYFRETRVRLTAAEMKRRAEEYVSTARDRFDADRQRLPLCPVANPSACCGSWKNDWQDPCLKVHTGMSPLEALEASPRYQPKDPYERYPKEDTEE